MTDEPTLKPCPFVKCGAPGIFASINGTRDYVRCSGRCDDEVSTPLFDSPEEAAAFWNDRADDGPMRHEAGVVLYKDCDPEIRGGAEPDDEIRVDDRVELELDGKTYAGKVLQDGFVNVWFGEEGITRLVAASRLTKLPPAPPPLPLDSIERFWIPGAWIKHETFPGAESDFDSMCIVLDDENLFVLHEDWMCTRTRAFDDLPKTGWSFHESSPIQTPKEPR